MNFSLVKFLPITSILFFVLSANGVQAGPFDWACTQVMKIFGRSVQTAVPASKIDPVANPDPVKVELVEEIRRFNAVESKTLGPPSFQSLIPENYVGLLTPYLAFLKARTESQTSLADIRSELRDLGFPFVRLSQNILNFTEYSLADEEKIQWLKTLSLELLPYMTEVSEIENLQSKIEEFAAAAQLSKSSEVLTDLELVGIRIRTRREFGRYWLAFSALQRIAEKKNHRFSPILSEALTTNPAFYPSNVSGASKNFLLSIPELISSLLGSEYAPGKVADVVEELKSSLELDEIGFESMSETISMAMKGLDLSEDSPELVREREVLMAELERDFWMAIDAGNFKKLDFIFFLNILDLLKIRNPLGQSPLEAAATKPGLLQFLKAHPYVSTE